MVQLQISYYGFHVFTPCSGPASRNKHRNMSEASVEGVCRLVAILSTQFQLEQLNWMFVLSLGMANVCTNQNWAFSICSLSQIWRQKSGLVLCVVPCNVGHFNEQLIMCTRSLRMIAFDANYHDFVLFVQTVKIWKKFLIFTPEMKPC